MCPIPTGIHLGLIYSWLATVGAEYFMTVGPGIGGLIIAGRERFQIDLVMLGVVLLGLVGFALNSIASRIEARLPSVPKYIITTANIQSIINWFALRISKSS